jgi:AcrR family transcriptional regulator
VSKLSRDDIIDEALALIKSGGESAVTMRALAARFDVTPMALYYYFADRDELLLALVERVSDTLVFPASVDDCVQQTVNTAVYLHDFLVSHPWMIRLISTGQLASAVGMKFSEIFLAAAKQSGLGTAEAFVFYRTMFALILGQATITVSKQQRPALLPKNIAADELPHVQKLLPTWAEYDALATPLSVFTTLANTLTHATSAASPAPRRSD